MSVGRMDFTKAALRSGNELCSFADLYGTAHSNSRNDISTLRFRGWTIDKWWTTHDDTVAHCHYRLVREPAPQPIQKRLALAGAS